MTFSQVRQYVKGLLSKTFSNKSVLDKLNESDNKLTYNGIQISDLANTGFTPVGTIISVMGVSAPTNYLVCNGQTVNIADYPELASYFEQQFGSKNKFGGNGTTTFAVPDLRGEFLRGTGTNSHANQGSGANVGVHQDATQHVWQGINMEASGTNIWVQTSETRGTTDSLSADKFDTLIGSSNKLGHWYGPAGGSFTGAGDKYYTSRPTNTSVLYCIATKNIYIDARFDYSTEERVVGEWIDGKPIYQKTWSGLSITLIDEWINAIESSSVNIEKCISGYGYENSIRSFPLHVRKNGSFVQIFAPAMANIILTEITLQYTKTTDTAS